MQRITHYYWTSTKEWKDVLLSDKKYAVYLTRTSLVEILPAGVKGIFNRRR